MAVPQDLLDILACPVCKTPVVLSDENEIVCCNIECRRAYVVRDDIPVMLIEEARVLDAVEWERLMAAHGDPLQSPRAGFIQGDTESLE